MKEFINDNGSKWFEGWTMSDFVTAFREMWMWISLETRKRKRKVYKYEYFHAKAIDPDIIWNTCFLCQYTALKHGSLCTIDCALCPVELDCHKYDSLYEFWVGCSEDEWEDAAEYAARIAVVPLKKTA